MVSPEVMIRLSGLVVSYGAYRAVDGSIWIAKFYAPLLWLCDHVGWLSYLVNSYINWWIL